MAHHTVNRAETSAELTMTEFRERVTRLPEDMEREHWTSLAVTRRGEPVLAVIPWEMYEGLLETMEVLGDPEMMASIRASLREIAAGRTYTSAEARRKLGL
ncbi:MAG TPA: type II toxin-antitoxin system Phd/YefM family antitoxin [Armatimonadota bacterium]|jgi:PHD/YefM family antitoxin component YafN of YafNO toxin-antitoxin module